MFQVFNAGCMMFKSCQSSVNLHYKNRNVRLRRKKNKKKKEDTSNSLHLVLQSSMF